MAGNKRIQRAILATIATLVLVTACGRVAAPGAADAARVIRDPDNPYLAGHIPATTSSASGVVRDPDNPYWTGSTSVAGGAADGQAIAKPAVIRDPDNPYWSGR